MLLTITLFAGVVCSFPSPGPANEELLEESLEPNDGTNDEDAFPTQHTSFDEDRHFFWTDTETEANLVSKHTHT
jgi:hypothetical protein